VGRDDNEPSRFTGATGALPIWTHIMLDIKPQSFSPVRPEDVEEFPFDVEDSKHTSSSCDKSVMVPFIRGSMPTDFEPCDQWPEGVARPQEEQQQKQENNNEEHRPQKKKHKGAFDWFFNIFH
jgi:penicillin-binding protein 1B